MKSLLIAAAIALAAPAHAESVMPDTIGIHLYTWHFDKGAGYNNYNPGIYAEKDNVVVGIYYNSERNTSVYGGYIFKSVLGTPIDLVLGIVTGYRQEPFLPLVIPSVKISDFRISIVPNTEKSGWGMHFSYEF